MIKYVIWLWLVPMTLFWGWFGLSYHDINFGLMFFSRDIHNMVFGIYASILGVSYETIVSGFLKACIFDTFLIAGIVAYRKRAEIKSWWRERKNRTENIEEVVEPDQVAELSPMPAE